MEKEKLNSLAAQAAQGDSAAWEALYRAIEELTRSVCRRNSMSKEDTEDIVQEVALSLSGRLDELAGMENPEGYIRRAANNKCVDIVRADSKLPTERFREHEEVLLQKPDTDPTPENVVAGLNPDKLIDDFLSELPEDQRVCLTMRYMDGYTNKQISQRLGVPVGTVASRVRYAKSALQKRVTEYEKKYGVKLHAKWLLPFMPFRLFQGSVDILMTDGGSTVSEITRAVTGAVAVVVMGGAIIGSGLVFRNNEPPLPTQPAAVQTVTEPTDEQPRTAATVYRDVYETQTQTVYETQVQTVRETVAREPTASAQLTTEAPDPALPDGFFEGENKYDYSGNILRETDYHSELLNADITLPEAWLGKTEIEEENLVGGRSFVIRDIAQKDRQNGSDRDIDEDGYLLKFVYTEGRETIKHNSDIRLPNIDMYLATPYHVGFLRDSNGEVCAHYYALIPSDRPAARDKSMLDYARIGEEMLSVIESFKVTGMQGALTDDDKYRILHVWNEDW